MSVQHWCLIASKSRFKLCVCGVFILALWCMDFLPWWLLFLIPVTGFAFMKLKWWLLIHCAWPLAHLIFWRHTQSEFSGYTTGVHDALLYFGQTPGYAAERWIVEWQKCEKTNRNIQHTWLLSCIIFMSTKPFIEYEAGWMDVW